MTDIAKGIRMLKEAFECQKEVSGCYKQASGCLHLLDPKITQTERHEWKFNLPKLYRFERNLGKINSN